MEDNRVRGVNSKISRGRYEKAMTYLVDIIKAKTQSPKEKMDMRTDLQRLNLTF